MSTQISNFTTENCEGKVLQCVHSSLTKELQMIKMEEEQTLDDIIDRIVE